MYFPLPDFLISNKRRVSQNFLSFNLISFYEATQWVHQLPYGRNTHRSDYCSIFQEHKRTCSTKHAALSRLDLKNQKMFI